ncbi:hypothetical protein, partial [Streptomyces sp. NPDC101249]|uniref:hypothetical protein n=1 Tax=Streptomyces sp. NPDC101249 TaxID=3366140 RepID=UPI00380E3DA6
MIESAVLADDIDVLVVHIVGHGELAAGSSEKLYVLDADGRRLSRPVGGWIDLIEDHPDQHRPMTLFILDVCHAGEAAVLSWHARMEWDRRRAWVLAATGTGDRAFGFRLSRALVQVLQRYQDLEVRFDPSLRYIPPRIVWRDIAGAVAELAEQSGGLPQTIQTSLVPGHVELSHLPFFPNPSFASGNRLTAVAAELPQEIAQLVDWASDPLHFIRRAGGAEPVHRGWGDGCFTGRAAQLRELAAWLDDDTAEPGFRVVTGKPGVGKSALLGILVCAAHPVLRRHTRPLWAGLGDLAPGENERIAVVHARRLRLGDIVASLERQLCYVNRGVHRSEPDGIGAAGNPAEYLMGMVPADGPPVTVVVDALDEAQRPEDIATALLLPLARRTKEGRLRLLIGTRNEAAVAPLLAQVNQNGGCTDLSAIAPSDVRRDVAGYVRRLLSRDGAYAVGTLRTVRESLATAIAETLAPDPDQGSRVPRREPLRWGEFLAAGLYTHYLLHPASPPSSAEEATALGQAVPRSLPALLELDLRRHTDQHLLRPVLNALAFAQGRGMPESVLVHVAAAFTYPVGAGSLSPEDLYALLDGEARFYLRRDVDEDGTTVYRLFHEGLADWLRQPGSWMPPPDDPRCPSSSRATELLYERILDAVPRDATGLLKWHLAAPYLLRHTAQHAAAAGRLDELLDDGDHLVHADPDVLVSTLSQAGSGQARLTSAVYRGSWAIHHLLPPAERRMLLALDAARFRHGALHARLSRPLDWQVRWATGNQISSALVRTLASRSGWVNALAVAWLEDRPHAVTGSDDGSIRVWDLGTGTQVRRMPDHPNGWLNAVLITEIDHRPHAFTAGLGGTVRLWDLTTGLLVREFTGHARWVNAVAMAELDGLLCAVTGDGDGVLRVWSLVEGTAVRRIAAHKGWINAVAVTSVGGRPHAVTADSNGSVCVWDLTSGAQLHDLVGHTRWVNAVAVVQLGERLHAVTAGNGGSVRLWDLTTGTQVCELTGHTSAVNAVAVTSLAGVPHAVTGDNSGSVRLWDLTTGTQVRELTGHTSAVNAVAVVALAGVPHAITGSNSPGAVRVWDLTSPTSFPEPVDLHGGVNAVALTEVEGRLLIVSAADHGAVQVRDLSTGQFVRDLIGHTSGVNAVAASLIADRPHVITAGRAGSVRVWDLTTGVQTRELIGHVGWVNAVAITVLAGRPHAVTADGAGSVRVWDLTTGVQTRELIGHVGWVNAVAITVL